MPIASRPPSNPFGAITPQRLLWGAILGLLFLYNLSVFVPWRPYLPKDELDASWYMALHWAHIHGLDFGRDFVFTYGPWGFVFQGYEPSTYKYVVLGWTFLTIAFFAGMLRLATHFAGVRRSPDATTSSSKIESENSLAAAKSDLAAPENRPVRHRRTPPVVSGFSQFLAAIWLTLVIALGGASIQGIQDIRLFMIAWALLLIDFYADDRPVTWLKILLVTASAFGTLTKFSISIVCFLAVLAVSLEQLRRRQIPWLFFIYTSTVLLLWLAASQSPGSLALYLRHSWQIASAYAQGEGISAPNETISILLFALTALLVLVAALAANWHNPSSTHGVLSLGSLAIGLWLLFKMGYVRHDAHELLATSGLSLLILLYLATLWQAWRPLMKAYAVLLVAGSLALTWHSALTWSPALISARWGLPQFLGETFAAFPGRLSLALDWLTGGHAAEQEYAALLGRIRATKPLPTVRGTVDIYSWGQDAVLAHGLNYRPRPTIGSYIAYSTELAKLNADFLRSPRAPDSILFDLQYLDNRYPSQEDSLSWPELLTRYDLRDASTSLLLFERAPDIRRYSLASMRQTHASMNQWITVPSSVEPLWVTIKLKETFAGRLLQTAYKPPSLSIGIKTEGGVTNRHRLLPLVASGGFLLSPVVPDNLYFALLTSSNWREPMHSLIVTQMQVAVDTPSGTCASYERDYTLEFFRLSLPRRDISTVPGIAANLRLRQWLQPAHVLHADAPPSIVQGAGHEVLLAPAHSQLLLPVQPGATTLKLTFGILSQPDFSAPTTDAIEFRVSATGTANGTNNLPIFQRQLDPARIETDRGEQIAEIRLPTPAPGAIILETVPGPTGRASYSYWSDVLFY